MSKKKVDEIPAVDESVADVLSDLFEEEVGQEDEPQEEVEGEVEDNQEAPLAQEEGELEDEVDPHAERVGELLSGIYGEGWAKHVPSYALTVPRLVFEAGVALLGEGGVPSANTDKPVIFGGEPVGVFDVLGVLFEIGRKDLARAVYESALKRGVTVTGRDLIGGMSLAVFNSLSEG